MNENEAVKPVEEVAEIPAEVVEDVVDSTADHIESVEQEIDSTPAREIDEQWKRTITSELQQIRERLERLPSAPESSVSEATETADELEETPTEVQEIVVDAPKQAKATKRKGFRSLRRK